MRIGFAPNQLLAIRSTHAVFNRKGTRLARLSPVGVPVAKPTPATIREAIAGLYPPGATAGTASDFQTTSTSVAWSTQGLPARHSSRNMRWIRASSPSSGWNAEASSRPCRAATGVPSASAASVSTPAPSRSMAGARMNTARNGPPSRPATARSRSKLSSWGRRRCAAPRCPSRRGPAAANCPGRLRAGSCRRRCRRPAGPPVCGGAAAPAGRTPPAACRSSCSPRPAG